MPEGGVSIIHTFAAFSFAQGRRCWWQRRGCQKPGPGCHLERGEDDSESEPIGFPQGLLLCVPQPLPQVLQLSPNISESKRGQQRYGMDTYERIRYKHLFSSLKMTWKRLLGRKMIRDFWSFILTNSCHGENSGTPWSWPDTIPWGWRSVLQKRRSSRGGPD